MIAIRRLKWWQGLLLVAVLVYVTWAHWSTGGPADRSFAGWTGYVGAVTITIGVFLNCLVMRPNVSAGGWRSVAIPVLILLASGSLAVVVGFILGAAEGSG